MPKGEGQMTEGFRHKMNIDDQFGLWPSDFVIPTVGPRSWYRTNFSSFSARR